MLTGLGVYCLPLKDTLDPSSDVVVLLLWMFFVFVFGMLSCLFLAALLSSAGKGLTSCVLCFLVFLSLSHFLGQVWYLMVSIPDLCFPLFFETILFNFAI